MFGKTETRVGIFVLAALAVFIYMGFQIGAFRLDQWQYNSYVMYFKDISGIARKSEVKIAGVRVGWVEQINLIPDDTMQAGVTVMILKDYSLYGDACAVIRQDGFIGSKYIEIIPGDPLLSQLQSGQPLCKPSTEPVAMDELLQQLKKIAANVEQATDSFKDVVRGIGDLVPSIKEKIDNVSTVFDRDLNHVSRTLESTAQALQQAAHQAYDGLCNASSVAHKIDEGAGTIGKLINDEEPYRDLKSAIKGFKDYTNILDRMQIVFDSHFESMVRIAENYEHEDAKGYFNVHIHPSEDYFYLIQLVTSEKGFIKRKERDLSYCDEHGREVDPDLLDLDDEARLRFVFRKKKEKFDRNGLRVGLQIGKVFRNVAFRIGLLDGTGGFGLDIDIPFATDKFRWVTTFEMFDFTGWNRKDDRRPHLKWLNKMFVLRNISVVFGADDFISKRNSSVFFGAGLRFGDNDAKYVLPGIGGAGVGTFNS